MIVIDIGCADHGGRYDSINHLIETFHPDTLYGFDPHSSIEDMVVSHPETEIVLTRKAAWTFDGELTFVDQQLGSYVTDLSEGEHVHCFDLAAFIKDLYPDQIALKMDAEGTEYTVLPYLIEKGVDRMLSVAWIEWHPWPDGDPAKRKPIEEAMRCEMAQWNL